MKVRIAGPFQQALIWRDQLENLGEDWQCVSAGEELLLILPGPSGAAALQAVTAHPPIAPPYVLGDGAPDGPLPAVEELPGLRSAWRTEGYLPSLTAQRLPQAERLARALLHALAAPPRLKAWRFLPRMCALTAVHPSLLTDLRHSLYPMIAREMNMTPAAVERSLRLWVESAWMHGSLPAIERLFGASVDPEKGKPTNREFLCRVQDRITLAMARLI